MATPNREVFKNDADTTLNGGINNSVTTITVTDGSVFPSTGNFRILIEDEIILVTARSTHVLTVERGVEGTAADSHSDSAVVTHIITAQSIANLVKDNSALAFISPALNRIEENGVLLDSSDFTWVNQSTSVAADVGGTISIVAPATSGENCRILARTAPGTPYAVVAAIQGLAIYESGAPSLGIGFRESGTGKLHTFGFGITNTNSQRLVLYDFTDPDTYGGTSRLSGLNDKWIHIGSPTQWLKIEDTGTNLVYSVSLDGIVWVEMLSHSRTAHMSGGPDEVFFYINMNSATDYTGVVRLVHWHIE
jgi:hypothetical protein